MATVLKRASKRWVRVALRRKARQHNERFWGYYSQVVGEISRMGCVFASYDSGWVPEVREISPGRKAGSVEYRVKRHLNSDVILLVNAADTTTEVEILAPQMSGRAIRLWGGGGTVRATPEGVLRDRLEPFGVRVYSDAPDLLSDFSDSMIPRDGDAGTSNAT